MIRQTVTAEARIRRHSRKEVRAIVANQRPGLRILRLCRFQGLVRDADLFFQRIQLRITVYLPPFAFCDLIARLRGPPRAALLIFRRRDDRRRLVLGPDRAGGQNDGQKRCNCGRAGKTPSFQLLHDLHCAFSGGRWPTRTCCPCNNESSGFTMISSLPVRPATISTSGPKSRPTVTGSKSALPLFTVARRKPSDRNIRDVAGTM